MSYKLIALVLLIHFNVKTQIYGTRLPLEIYDSTTKAQHSTAVQHNSNLAGTSSSSSSRSNSRLNETSSTTSTTTAGGITANLPRSEHRKGRQMAIGLENRGPRILYQVGNSEDDLPTCAPNAVCSKVDLYETPWIERQCKCPEPIVQTHNVIYHHKMTGAAGVSTQNGKYHHDATNSNSNDHTVNDHDQHIRELLRKLGTIYNSDDIIGGSTITSSSLDTTADEYDEMDAQHFFIHQNHKKYTPIKATKFRHNGNNNPSHRFGDFPRIGGCSSFVGTDDGHTIADKTRQYKLCEPIHKLPTCRYFRDYTWTLISSLEANATEQVVHCRCPKNSVTYLIKREPLTEPGKTGYKYLFACSPQSRLRCLRKEPCKLFTVRKRQEFLDEVNTNPLCQCPRGHACPKHHTDAGVISGKSYIEENIRTYSGYCLANPI